MSHANLVKPRAWRKFVQVGTEVYNTHTIFTSHYSLRLENQSIASFNVRRAFETLTTEIVDMPTEMETRLQSQGKVTPAKEHSLVHFSLGRMAW